MIYDEKSLVGSVDASQANLWRHRFLLVLSLPAAFVIVRYLAMVLCCRIEPEVWILCEPDCGVPFYPVAMLIVFIRGMRGRVQLVLLIRQEFNLPSARVEFPLALYGRVARPLISLV
jgi:hypothetical protein